MTGLHADALAALTSWAAPTSGQEALRRRYVEHLRTHPDGLARACRPDHITASTLVFDPPGTRVLLTLHAKSGRWFQFGGHPEAEDRTLAGAALREAVEESGLDPADLALDSTPALLDAHPVPFCGPGEGVHHLDVMFRAVAREGARHAVSEESLDVAWWPVDALPTGDLLPFVELARARPGQPSASEGGGLT